MKKLINFSHLAAILAALLLAACSAVIIDNDSPADKQFKEGERLLNNSRYLEAIERFRIIKSRYPYTSYAPLATLGIANAYFKQESFIEADSAYKIFLELYPKHNEKVFALYRIAESQYLMVPSAIDRDLSNANNSIRAFKRLNVLYPGNKYQEEASKKIKELRGKLASKEAYIGNFYFIRDFYNSASLRYRSLLDKFGGLGYDEEALYRLAYSYGQIGEKEKAKEAIENFQERFPKSKLLISLKSLESTL